MRVTERKFYEPVSRCIYCGSTDNLTDEHIVPFGLGGAWVLPESSCPKCQKITCKVEDACLRKMLKRTRIQRGLPTRRKTKRRAERVRAKVVTKKGAHLVDVPYGNAPKILAMMTFLPPDILLGLAAQTGNVVHIGHWAKTDLGQWAKRHGVREARSRVPLHPLFFARMLAKIAHSFAIAKLGAGTFQPLLPDLILGQPDWLFTYVIGGELATVPATDNLHELSLGRHEVAEDSYWVARIRLFADEGAPVYNVVVGPPNPISP